MTILTGCSTGRPRRLVDDVKDLLDILSGGVGERPSGQRLGDRIEVIDAAVGIGGDDAIADGGEGDLEPVPPLEDRVVYLSGMGVVRLLRVAHERVLHANSLF